MATDHWRKQFVNGRLQFVEWPVPEMVLTGARFRNGRIQAGITQREVARRSDVSQSVISRFERGVATGISAERIVRIALAIGPTFPFGFCPHHDDCAYPFDPRRRRSILDKLD